MGVHGILKRGILVVTQRLEHVLVLLQVMTDLLIFSSFEVRILYHVLVQEQI